MAIKHVQLVLLIVLHVLIVQVNVKVALMDIT